MFCAALNLFPSRTTYPGGETMEGGVMPQHGHCRAFGIVAAIFLMGADHAFAQMEAATADRVMRQALDGQLGPLSVSAQPGFVDGRLSNCTIDYGVLAKDWAYKQ